MSALRSTFLFGFFAILTSNFFSCSIATKHEKTPEAPPAPVTEAAVKNPLPTKSYAEQTSDGMAITMKPTGKTLEKGKNKESVADRVFAEKAIAGLPNAGDVSHLEDISRTREEKIDANIKQAAEDTAGPEEAATADVRKPGAVPWSQALGWMKNGNLRFVKGRLRKDGQSMADVKRLAAGQKPHTIVLSCSDSRVPPELVFDEKLGEIFVVRVAGEMLDSGTIGSIEYGVKNLGANLILVMGHTSCGAVKAAHTMLPGSPVGHSSYDKIIEDIQPRLKVYAGQTPSRGYVKESWANVKGVAKDLLDRSPDIATAVKAGDLKIAEAMYDTTSGVVTFW